MKIALLVAYDGTDFHGFARQRSARSVQGVLEERLSLLLREPVSIVGAGRTDAGVHAAGQVVSFEAPASTSPSWVQDRLNRWLAPEVSVRAAAVVPDSFSARFDAMRREYEYRVYRSPTPDPFLDRFALWVPDRLRLGAMREGARALIGEHDFSSFCRRGQGSMVRYLRAVRIKSTAPARPNSAARARVATAGPTQTYSAASARLATTDRSPTDGAPTARSRSGGLACGAGPDSMLIFEVVADSFCHQMVRSIVGLLLDVGKGKREPSDVRAALGARDRASAGSVAPARALHLVRVVYRPAFRGATLQRPGEPSAS